MLLLHSWPAAAVEEQPEVQNNDTTAEDEVREKGRTLAANGAFSGIYGNQTLSGTKSKLQPVNQILVKQPTSAGCSLRPFPVQLGIIWLRNRKEQWTEQGGVGVE